MKKQNLIFLVVGLALGSGIYWGVNYLEIDFGASKKYKRMYAAEYMYVDSSLKEKKPRRTLTLYALNEKGASRRSYKLNGNIVSLETGSWKASRKKITIYLEDSLSYRFSTTSITPTTLTFEKINDSTFLDIKEPGQFIVRQEGHYGSP